MNNFKLNTDIKYNLFELCGRTTRITVCSWDSVELDKYSHNSATYNLDTKWYFDNIQDLTINKVCEHYETNKYYRSGDLSNIVVQLTIIPASIYTAKGMFNGYMIISNDFINKPYIVINNEYPYTLYDNPSEPAYTFLKNEYDKRFVEYNSINDYINYITNNTTTVLDNIYKEITDKYERIIQEEFENRKQELNQNLEIKHEEIKRCKAFAQRNKRIAEALHIDLDKYKQLFDND